MHLQPHETLQGLQGILARGPWPYAAFGSPVQTPAGASIAAGFEVCVCVCARACVCVCVCVWWGQGLYAGYA